MCQGTPDNWLQKRGGYYTYTISFYKRIFFLSHSSSAACYVCKWQTEWMCTHTCMEERKRRTMNERWNTTTAKSSSNFQFYFVHASPDTLHVYSIFCRCRCFCYFPSLHHSPLNSFCCYYVCCVCFHSDVASEYRKNVFLPSLDISYEQPASSKKVNGWMMERSEAMAAACVERTRECC